MNPLCHEWPRPGDKPGPRQNQVGCDIAEAIRELEQQQALAREMIERSPTSTIPRPASVRHGKQ